jgi:iron complex outermembrane receptor protein
MRWLGKSFINSIKLSFQFLRFQRFLKLLLVALLFLNLKAEKDYFSLSLEELLQLEVTSVTRSAAKFFHSPASIQIFTQEDFKYFPGSRLSDVLKAIVGAQSFQIDKNSSMFSIRGSVSQFANKLQILINGQNFTNFPFSGAFWGDFDLPLSVIERIEILKGPAGSVWGSNNVLGVVNIILKGFEQKSNHKGFWSAGVSDGKPVSTVLASVAFDSSRRLTVFGDGISRGASKNTDVEELKPVDELSAGYFGASFLSEGEKSKLKASVLRLSDSKDSWVNLIYPPKGPHHYLKGSTSFDGTFVTLAPEMFFESFNLLSSVSFAESDKDYIFVKVLDQIFSLDFRLEKDIGWGKAVVGIASSYTRENSSNTEAFAFLPERRVFTVRGVYSQLEGSFGEEKWSYVVSARLEDNSFTDPNFSPNLRLGYNISKDIFSWVSFGQAFRLPSRIERDIKYGFREIPVSEMISVLGVLLGQSNVRAERLQGADLGARFAKWEKGFLDVALFYYDFDNLVTFSPRQELIFDDYFDSLVLPIDIVNNGEGHIRGLEIFGSWVLSDNIKCKFGYSFATAGHSTGPYKNDIIFIEPGLRLPEQAIIFYPEFSLTDNVYASLLAKVQKGDLTNALPFGSDDLYFNADASVTFSISSQDSLKFVARNLIHSDDFESIAFAAYTVPTAVERTLEVIYTRQF